MRLLCVLLLLLGLVKAGSLPVTVVSTAVVPDALKAASVLPRLGESVPTVKFSPFRKLKRTSNPTPFPTVSSTNAPSTSSSDTPSAVPTPAPTQARSSTSSFIYHTLWSFVCPVLSLSIMAWAVQRSSKRRYVCCGTLDTVPTEITVVTDHSIVGDASTDVELMPVTTLRSHEWTDSGADPAAALPVQVSYDWSSDDADSITKFVRMKD